MFKEMSHTVERVGTGVVAAVKNSQLIRDNETLPVYTVGVALHCIKQKLLKKCVWTRSWLARWRILLFIASVVGRRLCLFNDFQMF